MLAAVGEHNQQQCYAAAVHGAQRLQNAALEGMPLAQDCYRTWKVAEMEHDTAANLRSGRTQAFATWADVTGVAMAA